MNVSMWTCPNCKQANGKGKKTCRCGTPKPTAFVIDTATGKTIIGATGKTAHSMIIDDMEHMKQNDMRKAGEDRARKQSKNEQRRKTAKRVKNMPEAPEGQIFQSAMKKENEK